MSKTHSNTLIVLLAITLAVLAYIAWGSADRGPADTTQSTVPQSAGDPREAVLLNAEQLRFALGQMRGFLEAFEDLEAAEIEGDTQAMARIAGAHGPAKRPVPEGFRERLPDSFRAMSRKTRASFAAMERDLSNGDLDGYRQSRLEALGTCNTCHSAFRFALDD